MRADAVGAHRTDAVGEHEPAQCQFRSATHSCPVGQPPRSASVLGTGSDVPSRWGLGIGDGVDSRSDRGKCGEPAADPAREKSQTLVGRGGAGHGRGAEVEKVRVSRNCWPMSMPLKAV